MKLRYAAVLGFVAVAAMLVSYQATGVLFREPLDMTCYQHAPEGWHENVRAEARFTHVPPRIRCDMTNPETGQAASWDSGSASLPGFVVVGLAGLGALAVVAGRTR